MTWGSPPILSGSGRGCQELIVAPRARVPSPSTTLKMHLAASANQIFLAPKCLRNTIHPGLFHTLYLTSAYNWSSNIFSALKVFPWWQSRPKEAAVARVHQSHKPLLVLSELGKNIKHCRRHNGLEGRVHITSSYTILDQISMSNKLQLQNLAWTSTSQSWTTRVLKVWTKV